MPHLPPIAWVVFAGLEALSLTFVVPLWRRPGRLGSRLAWSAALVLLPVAGPICFAIGRAFDETLGSGVHLAEGEGDRTEGMVGDCNDSLVEYGGGGGGPDGHG